MAAANSMNSAMNYPHFQSQQPQIQHQGPPQIQLPTNQEHYLNGEAAMSPSRSVTFQSKILFRHKSLYVHPSVVCVQRLAPIPAGE